KMHATIHADGQAPVLELAGDLSGAVAFTPDVEQRVQALFQPGAEVRVDVSQVKNLSGIGLRFLLLLHRQGTLHGAKLDFIGASEELRDLIRVTGFGEMGTTVPPAALFAEVVRNLPRIDIYPTHGQAGFGVRPGFPLPLGATVVPGGVNFAVFSRHATSCTLVLFARGAVQPSAETPFPDAFRVGHVWAMVVVGLAPDGFDYGFRMAGPWDPRRGHRFDARQILLDPQARAITSPRGWSEPNAPGDPFPFRGSVVPSDFDW